MFLFSKPNILLLLLAISKVNLSSGFLKKIRLTQSGDLPFEKLFSAIAVSIYWQRY
jgi:hypothetical protein